MTPWSRPAVLIALLTGIVPIASVGAQSAADRAPAEPPHAAAASAPVPVAAAAAQDLDHPRLAPVRAELAAILAELSARALPGDLVLSKVREGLAKQVEATRILAAARLLSGEIGALVALGQRATGRQPPPGLLRALVGARRSGIAASQLEALLGALGARGARVCERAVTTLTDLVTHDYPVAGARDAIVVVGRHGDAERRLGGLVRALEGFRRSEGLTPSETLGSLGEGLRDGLEPGAAARRAGVAAARGRAAPGRPKAPAGRSRRR